MTHLGDRVAYDHFTQLIRESRDLAEAAGLVWELEVDDSGLILNGQAWDLRAMRNEPSLIPARLAPLARIPSLVKDRTAASVGDALSPSWQDLVKAIVARSILVDRNGVSHTVALAYAVRALATVAGDVEPWCIDRTHAKAALEAARASQDSGKAGDYVRIVCQKFIDRFGISENCPVGVFPRARADRADNGISGPKLADSLSERKNAAKLPDRRAFWELQRIIWTEAPTSFHDLIRFAMLRVATITGLRIGECARLPVDYRRTVPYFDQDGTPAAEIGGVGEAVSLRYFAEKQDAQDRPLGALIEGYEWIPRQFESAFDDTIASVIAATAPLRSTLRAQCASGRVLPQYHPTAMIPALDALIHLTGSTILWKIPPEGLIPLLAAYRSTYDPTALAAILEYQSRHAKRITSTVSRYLGLLQERGVSVYNDAGAPWQGLASYRGLVRVADVEAYAASVTTKLSDTTPFVLSNGGTLQPWELAFLHPKRALGEGRDGNPCNTSMYAFVGVVSPDSVMNVLGEKTGAEESLFERYSKNDEDRALVMISHSLRHLLSSDLFRIGVSDAMITKQFGRASVAQAYEYDHRSLGETLMALALPTAIEEEYGRNTAFVASLIANDLVAGPIVTHFREIQAAEGDDAALAFLAAEADGFHVTPYGFCLRSFSVAPCPKHLECFNNCIHATATGLPEHSESLVQLERRLGTQLQAALNHPADTIGRSNQIQHAETRLAGVRAFLAAQPGKQVFPHGVDRSRPQLRGTPLDA